MHLRDEVAFVEQRELEVRKIVVQAPPVLPHGVVVHECRKGVEDLRAHRAQVVPVGIADDLHQRSSSATAWAASPSPRPVKPRRSVVVARTFTSPPASASERRAHICSRCAAILGSSPTSTQSALTSVHPAAWTEPYASRRSSTLSAPR